MPQPFSGLTEQRAALRQARSQEPVNTAVPNGALSNSEVKRPSRNPFSRLDNWVTKDHTSSTLKKRRPGVVASPEVLSGQGTRFKLKVDSEGRLAYGPETSPEMKTLLEETVAGNDRRFEQVSTLANGETNGQSRALLKDREGLVHYLSSTPASMTAMHSSLPAASGELDLPGYEHEALMSRVHKDAAGNTFRLHDQQLMSFAAQEQQWSRVDTGEQSDRWKSLQTSAGRITAQVDVGQERSIVDLTADGKVLFQTKDAISAYHQNGQRQLTVVTKSESGQSLRMLNPLSGEEQRIAFTVNDFRVDEEHPPAKAGSIKHVAVDDDHVYLADAHGVLFTTTMASIDAARQSGQPVAFSRQDVNVPGLSKDQSVTGFFNDSRGQLNTVIKDEKGQSHTCPVKSPDDVKAGWNIGDSFVSHHTQGLTSRDVAGSYVHQERFGSMRLGEEGRVSYKDPLSGDWRTLDNGKKFSAITRGLDGNSYAVVDGQLRSFQAADVTDRYVLGSSIYSIPMQRNQPKLGRSAMGAEESDRFISAAVIDNHHYVGLDSEGSAHVRMNSQAHNRAMRQTVKLPALGIPAGEKLAQIHMDRDQNLIGVTANGAVYQMPKGEWNHPLAGRRATRWQPMSLPMLPLINTPKITSALSSRQELSLSLNGESFTLKDGQWQAGSLPESRTSNLNSRFDQAFTRLSQAEKSMKVRGREMRFTMGLAGFNNAEKTASVQSGFRERLRAHYVRMDMSTPRPVKIAGDAIQHSYRGREGLSGVYEEAARINHEMESLSGQQGRRAEDIHQRLSSLEVSGKRGQPGCSLGEEGQRLLDEIRLFTDEVDRSSFRLLSNIANHAGLTDKHGQLKAEAKAKHQHGIHSAKGHNLAQELKTLWDQQGLSSTTTGKMLEQLHERGIDLSHSKSDIALGRRRDTHDEHSLVKSRLSFNTLTLMKMQPILAKLEMYAAGNAAPSERQMNRLWEDLSALRDEQYRDNPVKVYTDMGHASYGDLEANYDVVKGFMKALRKDDHGVTMTSRSALDAKNREELRQTLKEVLGHLREGETLSLGRAYEAGVSTMYVPGKEGVVFTNAVAGANSGVNRAMTITRDENEIYISFARNKAQGITGGAYIGKNVMPLMAGLDVNDPDFSSKFKMDVGNDRDASLDVRAGITVSNTLTHAARHGLEFRINEAELDNFVDRLMDSNIEQISPKELLELGFDHRNRHGHTVSFSVDLVGKFGLRAAVGGTGSEANPGFKLRGEAGVGFANNMLSFTHTRDKENGEAIHRQTANNRAELFNKTQMSAGLTAQGVTSPRVNRNGDSLQQFSSFTGIEAKLSFEDASSRQVDVQIQEPGGLPFDSIKTVLSTLSSAFTDAPTQRLLNDVKNDNSLDGTSTLARHERDLNKLRRLHSYFTNMPTVNMAQRSAVTQMEDTLTAGLAHKNHSMVLGKEVKYSTHFSNLARLTQDNIVEVLLSHIDDERAMSNAERLRVYAEQDPNFAALLKHLQDTPRARCKVTMELRADIKQKASRMLAQNKISAADIALLMKDPKNLRIKDFKVLAMTGLNETFNAPALFVGGKSSSNVGLEKLIGKVKFHYGEEDTGMPLQFSFLGESAHGKETLRDAAQRLATQAHQQIA
ncbi:AvrE-family type 3 secretion system effector [Pokkaliibacter sp. CJK22405]|uniref:AvrE-family type 3 secretion system effector n=1 Tax=Pokkaliibacter sp. CJK22405 TaxID=3384615 RepID=UPI00398555AD